MEVPGWVLILSIVLSLGVGAVLAGFFMFQRGKDLGKDQVEQKYIQLGKDANKIIEDAKNEGESKKKELIAEGKAEVASLKKDFEHEMREKKNEIQEEAKKLERRENSLDSRSANLDKRENNLEQKENKLEQRILDIEKRSDKIEELITEQEKKLMEISGYTQEEARAIVMQKLEEEMHLEMANYVKEEVEKAKYEANRKSQVILANAIEGRNIRTIEQVTGVDLIIDDTPDSVVISCFDPIRREIARRTLEILVSDGRIQPPRIEEVFQRCTKDIENEIREEGEKAVFEVGIGKIHPELVKLIGRMHFRTSYGQNVLTHSKEVAFLAGKMAAEIGEDEILARRAGLLHDIGKATDHEQEGSHVEIGVEIATKFREHATIIDAIASHHGDQEATTIIANLVSAADTLSAARPGARSESLDNYIKRLEQLESLTNEFKGVDKTYALQAGRELRIIVKPEEISDAEAYLLARNIKNKIEQTMNYPGNIKVTVIRETRVQEIAR